MKFLNLRMSRLLAAALLLVLAGCSAVGVIESSDPMVKLQQSDEMIRQGRYTRAQQLYREALEIFQARNDQAGVAETYRNLSFFYRTPLPSNRMAIVPNDFSGMTNGIETRYYISIDYAKKALAIFESLQAYDKISNVHFTMGQSYFLLFNDKQSACQAFRDSREATRKSRAKDPNLQVNLPQGYKTFEEVLDKAEQEAGC